MPTELEETFMRMFAHMSPDAEAWRLPDSNVVPQEPILTEYFDEILAEDFESLLT